MFAICFGCLFVEFQVRELIPGSVPAQLAIQRPVCLKKTSHSRGHPSTPEEWCLIIFVSVLFTYEVAISSTPK